MLLAGEMADVLILVYQLAVGHVEVDRLVRNVEFKMQRILRRIETGFYEKEE